MQEIFIPHWDIFLQNHLNYKIWNPDIKNKNHLKQHELISNIFPKDENSYFLSFMSTGRNYFTPPINEEESYNLLEKIEGKRVKVFYALKKPNVKYNIGLEWFLLKKMHHKERLTFSKHFIDYHNFIKTSGQPVIIKSGSNKNAFYLLHVNKFLKT